MDDATRDEGSAGVTIDLAEARRTRIRTAARDRHSSRRTQPGQFQTPEWLERSFVLPLTGPGGPDEMHVPRQPRPLHDDLAPEFAERPAAPKPPSPAATFRRPSAPEIDFDRVVRRSDLSRTLTHAAMVSAGLTGLALVTVGAMGVRSRVTSAPVPQRQPG